MIDTSNLIARLEETKKLYDAAGIDGLEGALQAGEAIDMIRALAAENEALRAQNHCCSCGKPVDTREENEGGDPHGSQLTSGLWVCSSECWDSAIDTVPAAQVRKEALEEALEAARREHLEGDRTDDETDDAYDQGVTDCCCAIRALIEKEDGK